MGLRETYNRISEGLSELGRTYKHFSDGFHPVRDYIWPFRVIEALWAQRRVAYVLAAQPIIQALTIFCFPTAQDYLTDQGVDPAIVAELSDKPIRVRERDILGTLHSYNDFPTLLGWAMGDAILSEPVQAYAFSPTLLGTRPVTLPEHDVTAADVVGTLAAMTDEERGAIERLLPADQQMRLLIAFHEFGHCHTANHEADTTGCETSAEESAVTGHFAECDADARAIAAAADVFKDRPDIAQALLYARALNEHAGTHDTALYLDAVLNGRKPDPGLESLAATEDAFAQLDIYSRTRDVGEGKIARALALQDILDDYPDLLSPLARRRAELFIEGARYFFPAAFEKAQAEKEAGAKPQAFIPPVRVPLLAPV